MLQKNLKKSTGKLIHNIHHSHGYLLPSIFIQYSTITTYLHSHSHSHSHFHHNQCPTNHHNRSFSILQTKKPAEEPTPDSNTEIAKQESSKPPSKPKQDPSAVTTGNEKHIEVHAFRSLITIAPYAPHKKFPKFSASYYSLTNLYNNIHSDPDEIDINELSLSFTERRAARMQKKNQKKLVSKLGHEPTEDDWLDESDKNIKSMGKWSPAIAYEIWHSPPEVYDKIYGFESDCEPPDRHNISWKWLYKLWGYYSEREVRYRCALYTYMKAQRRCMNEQFWEIYELENTFRVELQLLCLHIWFAKIRMTDGMLMYIVIFV